ncbi:cell division protein FtsW [Filimonas zeae]|uniref:Probable peptidoglycan glycosyltransferase FtsW n=1 Tax=Filimonas zeae TaxID=1737353 RepID=A0A917N0B0_9BACT|nr:putative peptidoglycan glycosyltransferase FtsW [Filimonas zeae]MDR6341970.1 cell division protein FtsW [Filimonas zeae]GGH79628.1 cell division protein FtsW [Filimonas zeae]
MTGTSDKLFAEIGSAEEAKGNLLSKTKGDKFIWGIVILLAMISLLVVYSATGSLAYKMYKGNTEVYLFKQLSFIILGLLVIYFLHRVNYTVYSRVAMLLFAISIPLLAYTLFFGTKINDGSRWIRLPVINMTIQTSDLAKLALFMYLSRQLSRKQEVIKDFKKGFLPLLAPIALTCMLIMPANLSNALLTGAISLLLLFIGRVSVKHILLVVGLGLIPIAIIISMASYKHNHPSKEPKRSGSGVFVRLETWISRVESFMYAKDTEVPYQVQQAKMAIANGGVVFGLGPGNSRQRNYLPQAYNDFIYSIIIEEYGLLGGAFIIFIYLLFLFRCIRLFRRCPYAFGAFLALALSFTLVIQAVANMAVNVNIVPVTGVTLPLVSMGGSSFLFTCAAIGIILSVARNLENTGSEKELQEVPVVPAAVPVAS